VIQMNTESTPTSSGAVARIAVLGTGKMGAAIAGRLAAAGYSITVWNRTRARAEALSLGRVAESPAAAVADADLVISSLTGPEAVRAAYLGQDGALTAGSGKLFVEMSTAGPDLAAELVAAVDTAGGRLIVAPIMGPPTVVREGKAAVIVGGSDGDVAVARPVLEQIGSVRHVGSQSNAAILKLVANSMLADVVLAAAELQVAGERSGLDPTDVFWAIERLAPVLAARRRGYVENSHAPALFAVRDLRKDLDFAVSVFDAAGAATPQTHQARDSFVAASANWADLDISAAVLPFREPPART
jgi:3-hydroxyisobutyrate dehydrogenase-like beta-hydroxyacid dehydrogenase